MVSDSGGVEEGVEDFEGAFADSEFWLDVFGELGCRDFGCCARVWGICHAFGLRFDPEVWFCPTRLRLRLSKV